MVILEEHRVCEQRCVSCTGVTTEPYCAASCCSSTRRWKLHIMFCLSVLVFLVLILDRKFVGLNCLIITFIHTLIPRQFITKLREMVGSRAQCSTGA